jgi:hypothetical protein
MSIVGDIGPAVFVLLFAFGTADFTPSNSARNWNSFAASCQLGRSRDIQEDLP